MKGRRDCWDKSGLNATVGDWRKKVTTKPSLSSQVGHRHHHYHHSECVVVAVPVLYSDLQKKLFIQKERKKERKKEIRKEEKKKRWKGCNDFSVGKADADAAPPTIRVHLAHADRFNSIHSFIIYCLLFIIHF